MDRGERRVGRGGERGREEWNRQGRGERAGERGAGRKEGSRQEEEGSGGRGGWGKGESRGSRVVGLIVGIPILLALSGPRH